MWTLKPLVWAVIGLGFLGLLSCFSTPKPINPIQQPIQPTKDALEQWIDKLAFCESSNNPLAVNPKDRDGRPKYGIFQFDMNTWRRYIKAYNLFSYQNWEEADWWNAIYSKEHQEIVLREMIKNGVDLRKEFGCVKKIGQYSQ